MIVKKASPCKVNLLLNILGKRPDGFHELETLMHPVRLFDDLVFERAKNGVHLTCSDPRLPTDSGNLVFRAATAFLATAGITEGVRLHLEKHIPMAAGLGGGSGNAATTLLGLNELFGQPLSPEQLHSIAGSLGSDIPFFLQQKPALATGRGERIEPLDFFPALRSATFLLLNPGFGIATNWAYGQLSRFPSALQGKPGRAHELVTLLRKGDVTAATGRFYNSLEAPAFHKFPILAMYQEFLRGAGAMAALMSGSGSTTFALVDTELKAKRLGEEFKAKFGPCWSAVIPAQPQAPVVGVQ
jgi:4-diphosphocytidyl-2-C-methyl-D-erythritol kinase